MDDTEPRNRARRDAIKTAVFICLVAIILLVGVILAIGIADKPDDANRDSTKTQNTTKSPDQVKDSGGPNGDITPSPNGTGPGSDNSLLSQ